MNRMRVFALMMSVFLVASTGWAQTNTPDGRIPKSKWLDGAEGYAEALELQKATGADLIIYFARYDQKDEKGLCHWWEKHGLQSGKVHSHLRDLIKVKVELPLKKKEEADFAAFRFNKTPAVFIKPGAGGYPVRCPVFDWPNDKPKLKSPEELVELFQKAGSPRTSAPAPESPP